MKCSECQNLLGAYVEGLLKEPEQHDVSSHLETCPNCKRESEGYTRLHERLVANGNALSGKALEDRVMNAICHEDHLNKRRNIMQKTNRKRRLTFAACSAVVVIAAIGIISLLPSKAAYAWEQTIEAIKQVRFFHTLMWDDNGQVKDERWIEIGEDGAQVRYRQDSNFGDFGIDILAVEDDETAYVYYRDKNTVVLKAKGKGLSLFGHPGSFFQDFTDKDTPVIEENVDYKSRPAHRVRWLELNSDFYINPETKLPIAGLGLEFSYEDPPEGTFEFVMPEGVAVVDERSGATPVQKPEWMKEEQQADENFNKAIRVIVSKDYQKAADLFLEVVKVQKGRNWAWYWLGKCDYELGEYDLAIGSFTQVIDLFHTLGDDINPHFSYLARGLAYRQKGMEKEAIEDFGKCLGVMIDSLRNLKGAGMFDYADSIRYRAWKQPNKQQALTNMINRLQEVTGENFGYDPEASSEDNESVIVAWEEWWQEHATEYGVALE